MFKVILATLLVFLATLLAVSAASASPPRVVDVVYFYPRDQEPSTDYIAEIDPAMADIQGWYETQVGSTFSLSAVKVVRGRYDASAYQGNIWGGVLTELGYYCGTGVHVIFAHPSLPFMGGGSCDPVYESGSGGGTAMISEGSSLGGWAHELGHAFALPHPNCAVDDCGATVMYAHWGYPTVGLLDTATAPEISSLQASPWFGGSGPELVCVPKFNPRGKLVGKCR